MEIYDAPAEISKSFELSRDRILSWAARHHLELYSGAPGNKHPTKTYSTDGSWRFTEWTGQDGPVLIRCNRYMVCMDGDGETGREFIATLGLPPDHFAIRSLGTGGEKRFGYSLEGARRAVRPLGEEITFDVLGNPDDKYIWIKIWDDCGYEIISDTDKVPDFSAAVEEINRRRGLVAAAQVITGKSSGLLDTSAGIPVEEFLEQGIEYGKQNDLLWRSACSLAARGAQPNEIKADLAEIVEQSETDPSRPWRPYQLISMAQRAWRRYGRPPAEVKQLEMAEPVVAPIEKTPSRVGATTQMPRACKDLQRDPKLARELIAASWDETGVKLNRGNDWQRAPRDCHAAYDYWLTTWANGTDVRTADLELSHLRWLETPGLFIGFEENCKRVQFLRTENGQVIFQDMALKDPGPEYPGWNDEEQDPAEGRRHGWRTKAAILAVIDSGKADGKPAIVRLMNSKQWREANPELDLRGTRGFKKKQVDKAVERLVADGQLMIKEDAIQYWRNRTWNTKPAVLAIPDIGEDDPPPDAPELEEDSEPGEKHQLLAAWGRRQMKKFTRAERKRKHGRPQVRGTPAGEETGRQRARAEALCPKCLGDLPDGRHHREMHRWLCPGS